MTPLTARCQSLLPIARTPYLAYLYASIARLLRSCDPTGRGQTTTEGGVPIIVFRYLKPTEKPTSS